MKNITWLTGSAEEVGAELQRSYDRMVESTRKWTEVLTVEPPPQTGLTPKDVVWRKNKARLYRYIGDSPYKYRTPILFIYALINKAYILDLLPGSSLVEHLVEQGFDVYLLDWGDFAWEDRNLSFGDLVYDYIARAVVKVCSFSECEEVTLIGYCMGGTMVTMYASLFAVPKIKNIMYLSSPFDYSDAGVASEWLKPPGFDADKVADTFNLVPREFVDLGVKMLRPLNNYWGTYTRLWKAIDEGTPVIAWKALNKWVNDNVNFPGEAYRQWIKDLYQGNKLLKNEFVLRRRLVEPKRIDSSILVLAGEKDHLVLPHQCEALLDHVSSTDKTYKVFPVGHGGLVFGSYAKKNVYPVISGWLKDRS